MTDEWIKELCMYTMEYYIANKRKGILSFETTQINQESIILVKEDKQISTNTVCFHLYVEPKKKKR